MPIVYQTLLATPVEERLISDVTALVRPDVAVINTYAEIKTSRSEAMRKKRKDPKAVELGKRGGAANTPAQMEARKKAVKKLIAARRRQAAAQRKAREEKS